MEKRPGPTALHLDLLATARAVRRAAEEDDLDRVHTQLCRLRSDLVAHLHEEQAEVGRLPGASPDVVTEGQQRLRRLVDDLLFASTEANDGCTCLLRTAELEHALRRQARLEATLLARHPHDPAW